MESRTLVRVGGIAAVVAGVILGIEDVLLLARRLTVGSPALSTVVGTVSERVTNGAAWMGGIVLVMAVVGLHERQRTAAGRLGLVGFLLALIGSAAMVGSDWAPFFMAPGLVGIAPAFIDHPPALMRIGFLANFLVYAVGWLLFGVATYRAQMYPRAAGVVFVVSVLGFLAPYEIGFLAFEVTLIWLGVSALFGTKLARPFGGPGVAVSHVEVVV